MYNQCIRIRYDDKKQCPFTLSIYSTNYGTRNVLTPNNSNGGNSHRRKSAVELTASLKSNKSTGSFGEGTKVKISRE